MAHAHTHQNTEDTHGDAHNTGGSIGLYVAIFAALLVLLFASVGVAYIRTEYKTIATFVGFTIATIKALLIILYFMHVRYSSKLTMVMAFGSFFFLLLMFGLTFNDYLTREPVVSSERYVAGPVEPSGQAEGYREPRPNYSPASDTENGK